MLKRLWKDESGQGMVEYGLIIALVAIVIIVALSAMGKGLGDKFTGITNALASASPGN